MWAGSLSIFGTEAGSTPFQAVALLRAAPKAGWKPERGQKRRVMRDRNSGAARSIGMASRQRRVRLDGQTGLTSSSTWSTTFPQNVSRNLNFPVRPEGAYHQWRKVPPRELSIALVADERPGRATGLVEAS